MGSVQRNPNGDCIEDTSVEQLLSPGSPDMYNVFGDPELHPRVGDDYQVEIPPLISKSQYRLYRKSPFERKSGSVIPCDFLIGLPIPIMHINKELEFVNTLENGLESGKSTNSICGRDRKKKAYQKYKRKGYQLLPGSVGMSWNEVEEGCFLLGLYIFGKDLVLVKKFVDSKTMGDIQSYYYGKFYKSDEYRRWSDCRKVRSRKCVYGHKIFNGMRQQELLSRLFLHVSEECKGTLSEVSKGFNDGKLSLTEYVLTLKALVGVKNFIEAVAIGKGKQDLTSITTELPLKPNQIAPPRPEVPSGKACSSLTPEEIMKFLTGDFRLSKARSNDLFWEAVWPRLLARGWHSEQPKDQIYTIGSKSTLVFLIPGVKKFSRRKLVKGNHYFDCITDVLNKVALDPSLLELDSEGDENNGNKEENGWSREMKPGNDDVSGRQRRCYLLPQTPKRGKGDLGFMKFTVVDTSMGDGRLYKMRKLRMLPDEVWPTGIVSVTDSEKSDESGSEDSSQDSDTEGTTVSVDQDCTAGNLKNMKTGSPPIRVLFQEKDIGTNSENKVAKGIREGNDLGEGKKSKPLKCYRGLKKGSPNYLSPITKRHKKLSSCSQNHKPSVGPTIEQEKPVSCSEATDSSENNQVDSFAKGDPSPWLLNESSFEGSRDEPQPRALIDLNLPQVLPEFESGDVLTGGLRDEKDDHQTGKSEIPTAPSLTTEVTSSVQQSDMNNQRRQSTRKRPPTMKALEALANGYLTINTRKKRKEAGPRKATSSRPSHRANDGADVSEELGNGSEDTQMLEVENGACSVDSSSFGEFQVFPEGNAAQHSC